MTKNEFALTLQLAGIAIPLFTIAFVLNPLVGALVVGAYLLWVGIKLEGSDDD